MIKIISHKENANYNHKRPAINRPKWLKIKRLKIPGVGEFQDQLSTHINSEVENDFRL